MDLLHDKIQGNTEMWMYRIQVVSTLISAKPVLLLVFYGDEGNFPAAKMETVVDSRGRLFDLRTRLPAGRSGVRIPMWKKIIFFFKMSRPALGSTQHLVY